MVVSVSDLVVREGKKEVTTRRQKAAHNCFHPLHVMFGKAMYGSRPIVEGRGWKRRRGISWPFRGCEAGRRGG